MKIRAADYIAELLCENGIHQMFMVVGGGAMHLDDAFGNHEGIRCIFNHHEQACAMAAEAYARVNNELAVACVTSGPGGTNAITGVLCAWNDSIPLLVISGQVRTDTTVGSTGLNLRQFGEQEYDIVKSVDNMTKYAEMITDSADIRYCVEKAVYLATHGRRGPCWLDIPLDIQGMEIDTETQRSYVPETDQNAGVDEGTIAEALCALSKAKRPVILAGSGIRNAGVYEQFREFVNILKIPVLAATGISDLFPVGAENYYGNFGVIGGRAGNFIVQNADCLLILGARLSLKQIGFNYEKFSPDSFKIMVDADEAELKKKTIHIDMPLCMTLEEFFDMVKVKSAAAGKEEEWDCYCRELRNWFPGYLEKFEESKTVNPYYFAKKLQELMEERDIVVVGNSCASDMTRQLGIVREGQRMWGNTNCGTMGYDVPAALGAAAASGGTVYCVTGDGSIMMNIQELQTIVHNRLPVKICIHNNSGYQAIVTTHTNFFGRLTGCTAESGISFPNFELLSKAFGMPYFRCENHADVEHVLPEFTELKGYAILEIFSDADQPIEPKTKSKSLGNGKMYSPPIDDLFPFLGEEEYQKYADYKQYCKEEGAM